MSSLSGKQLLLPCARSCRSNEDQLKGDGGISATPPPRVLEGWSLGECDLAHFLAHFQLESRNRFIDREWTEIAFLGKEKQLCLIDAAAK